MFIYLMAIVLSANAFVGQLLQLPVLVHHYVEHAAEDNMTFYDFLSIHYASNVNHPDDQHNDHKNLPFKSLQLAGSNFSTVAPSSIHFSGKPIISNVIKVFVCYQKHHASLFVNDIWQPPCIA